MKYSIIIAFISILLAIIIGIAFVFPEYQEINILKSKIFQKEKTLKNQQAYFSKLKNMDKRLGEYQGQLDKINTILPSKNKFSFFAYSLSQKSKELGLTLSQVVISLPRPIGKTKRIKEYDLSIGLTGSYQQFKQFIKFLENSARLTDIKEVTVSNQEGQEQPANCRIQARIYSY